MRKLKRAMQPGGESYLNSVNKKIRSCQKVFKLCFKQDADTVTICCYSAIVNVLKENEELKEIDLKEISIHRSKSTLTFEDTKLDVKGDKKEYERALDVKHVSFNYYLLATGDIVT